jgi:hypothetical protein
VEGQRDRRRAWRIQVSSCLIPKPIPACSWLGGAAFSRLGTRSCFGHYGTIISILPYVFSCLPRHFPPGSHLTGSAQVTLATSGSDVYGQWVFRPLPVTFRERCTALVRRLWNQFALRVFEYLQPRGTPLALPSNSHELAMVA